jgi:hypothetical protein
VTSGEDEPITVDPAGVRRVNIQGLTKENSTDVGGTQREAKVTGFACGDSVDGKTAGITCGELEE